MIKSNEAFSTFSSINKYNHTFSYRNMEVADIRNDSTGNCSLARFSAQYLNKVLIRSSLLKESREVCPE